MERTDAYDCIKKSTQIERLDTLLILTGLLAATGLAAIFKLYRIGDGIAVSLALEGILLVIGRICRTQKNERIH